jgi:hypothetical protein
MAVILAAMGIGMSVMAYSLNGETAANADGILINAQDIRANTASINQVKSCMDTIKADVGLVRCWARAEIEGTNPASCLVER